MSERRACRQRPGRITSIGSVGGRSAPHTKADERWEPSASGPPAKTAASILISVVVGAPKSLSTFRCLSSPPPSATASFHCRRVIPDFSNVSSPRCWLAYRSTPRRSMPMDERRAAKVGTLNARLDDLGASLAERSGRVRRAWRPDLGGMVGVGEGRKEGGGVTSGSGGRSRWNGLRRRLGRCRPFRR